MGHLPDYAKMTLLLASTPANIFVVLIVNLTITQHRTPM
jgi:hypothetical protein